MSKKIFLSLLILGVLLCVYAKLIEPDWLTVRRARVDLIDGDGTTITILHLTDFHWASPRSQALVRRAIREGIALKPDLILLTGDYVSGHYTDDYIDSQNYAMYRDLLRQLSRIAPAYGCMGNHDGGAWSHYDSKIIKQLVKDSGIGLLHNAHTDITVKGRPLTLIGVGDLWAKEFDPGTAFDGLPVKAAGDERLRIVLAHNPDAKEGLEHYDWDLMLAGHTHGGQIKIPFLGTPFAPVQDHDYVQGLKPWHDRWIYVSAGVGNLFGVRLNVRPDISLLEIY